MKTPEHFEKKLIPSANGFSPTSVQRSAHEAIGYNEALEKTNAKELYEALIMCHSLLKAQFGDGYKEWIEFKETEKAIEKANNQ